MAEAVAILGLVSSIIQIVEFGSEVVSRLNEFQSSVPKTFRDIKIQLPLLIDTLKQTQRQADAGKVSGETAKVLKDVVDGCLLQVRLLEDILVKAVPARGDSNWKRRFKAFSSFAHDGTVQQITATLERYVQTLTYYQATQQFKPVLEISHRKACFMVKFDRDPDFIGREEVIEGITERFKMRQHRVAIAGIGGVGKSQIAIEYCYRYRDSHTEAKVFWVHASNYARFEEGYKDIARELALPGFDDPDVNTLQLVLRWLSDDVNSPWLLVLDNADDMEILFGSNPHTSLQQNGRELATALASHLPRGSSGSIIITTRDTRVGEVLANRQKPILLLPFTTADAERLLRRKVPENGKLDKAESIELLEALSYLPLAITQAAAFINENDTTITEYLEMLRGGNSDTEDILKEDLLDPSRDPELSNSVFQTWKLSFDQIRKQKPRAAEILSLMAVLDRQAISDSLLRNGNERKIEFVTAIGMLKAFSLITEEKKSAIFGMHRLVQFSIQMWLGLRGELVMWQEKALEIVSNCCPPNGKYENWATWKAISPHVRPVAFHRCNASPLHQCIVSLGYKDRGRTQTFFPFPFFPFVLQLLYARFIRMQRVENLSITPHVQAVLGYDLRTESCLLQRAGILNGEGWYNREQEQYEVAHDKLIEALAIREKVLGPDHELTLDTVYNLGRLAESEAMYKRALSGYEKTLGPDHTPALETFNGLGILYRHQGKLTEAEAMYKRALAGLEKTPGPDHTLTLETVNGLGSLYRHQGKLAEAETMYKRALAGHEKRLGPDCTSALSTINNLGILYGRQGKLDEAEAMYKRALTGYEKTLGLDHTPALETVNNLGNLYSRQNKLNEAEAMYKQALIGYEKTLGLDHTSTLKTVNNLGILYVRQGKLGEAEAMYKRALTGHEKTLGRDHMSTLKTARNLSILYKRQGKLGEAEAMYKQVLEGYEKVLGPNHNLTLNMVNKLSTLYKDYKS
ncbi:MAG: hypothetical protein M1839_007737 [Geoglossum umbratile]|nr:MAG: hypothetical protein M1839_007737 [Geoglossum umbratile]